MPRNKKKIKAELRKKRAKLGDELDDLNYDADIVDLGNKRGDDIEVNTFENFEANAEPLPFKTTPQKEKKGLFGGLKSVFSQDNSILKKLDRQAEEVMAMEKELSGFSDEELRAQTGIFKERLAKGETLDDILVEAFAVAREATYRIQGLKAYKEQIMGGIALHNGDIAEMKTGEGKTLTAIMPVYLNALEEKGVHVVTVNEYLAGRDYGFNRRTKQYYVYPKAVDDPTAYDENGKYISFDPDNFDLESETSEEGYGSLYNNGAVFLYLGLSVGFNVRELSADDKRRVHECDVVYTTNAELGFDYLRDNMVVRFEDKVLRPLHYALVDEVDSILVDESRTPLIISGGKRHRSVMYKQADKFVKGLTNEEDYEVDIETKSATLTPKGIEKAEKVFHVSNLYDAENTALVHYINQALKANYTMSLGVEYMIATEDGTHDIRNASIMIIDQFTGRVMPGRAYSDGLHQAIEAKEGVPIKEETITMATITYQNFFRLFDKLSGMTGTAKTEEEEFRMIYNMRVVEIPTHKPVIRDDMPDRVYSTKSAKYKAIINEVKTRHAYGQPILLGTVAVETSELLSDMLKKEGIPHNVLNAKNHAKEAQMIAKAGEMGAVTIATNMAGRGTDIKLGEGVAEIGGLMVIGSERHESRRIDNQLRGRSGRQGDPGCSCFFVSFEDDLMQRFANERVQALTDSFLEDDAIESRMVSKSIESAQRRVEGQNFDIRKSLLEYDDVMRQQREIMYEERDEIMKSDDLTDIIKGFFTQAIELDVDAYTTKSDNGKNDVIDVNGLAEHVQDRYMLNYKLNVTNADDVKNDRQKVITAMSETVAQAYQNRINPQLAHEDLLDIQRRTLLANIDGAWTNHIDAMQKLRNGIYLRAYAQRDPLNEYTEEGFFMFEQMTKGISKNITEAVTRMGIRRGEEDFAGIPRIAIELTIE